MTLLIIIGAALVWIGIIWFSAKVGEQDSEFIGVPFALTVIGFICLIIAASVLSKKDGYRQGQIDYHNKIIKYELKMQSDSTIKWEEINK